MQFSEADKAIKNVRCLEGDDSVRITWHWPPEVEQVYIFPQDATESLADGKLFTAQEYKKLGGYVIKKKPGIFTYYIYPFLVAGSRTLVEQPHGENRAEHICKTVIDYLVTKKNGFFELALSSRYDVAEDIICYSKNEGYTYFFGEKLVAGMPIMRVVKADFGESLNIFISEQNSALYTLNKCDTMGHGLLSEGLKLWDFLSGKKTRWSA
ncbi:MAG: hypothetical protein FWB80_08895 [Defluviitaleaceae bacterium]|nr:hypothetical protein [Defluviitaleaceae bacterium]